MQVILVFLSGLKLSGVFDLCLIQRLFSGFCKIEGLHLRSHCKRTLQDITSDLAGIPYVLRGRLADSVYHHRFGKHAVFVPHNGLVLPGKKALNILAVCGKADFTEPNIRSLIGIHADSEGELRILGGPWHHLRHT